MPKSAPRSPGRPSAGGATATALGDPARLVSSPAVVARGFARVSRQVEKVLAEVDLTLPQYRLLAFLSRGQTAASKLAESLSVSAPSLTGLVDGLVSRGLVERQPDLDDRRRVTHRLTDDGNEYLERADAVVAERIGLILSHLPESDRGDAMRGLGLLVDAFERMHAERHQARADAATETEPESEPTR